MSEHREIAKIARTTLGWEDHGILTCWLHLEYGSGGQGAGGYALDQYDEDEKRRVGHRACADFLTGVMRACGVDEWGKLKGRTVFAIRENDRFGAKVIGLEPLPTEGGERFMFEDAFEAVES